MYKIIESQVLKPLSTITPGSRIYRVQVTQGERSVIGSEFTVVHSESPKVRFHPWEVNPGEMANAILAGLKTGQRLYLYRLNKIQGQWELQRDRNVQPELLNSNGEATLSVLTVPEDEGHCFFVHTGEPTDDPVNHYDPRVFSVGVPPGSCN